MVTRTGALVAMAVSTLVGTACFDPTVPQECEGAVCGEIMDLPDEGGSAPVGAGGMGTGGNIGGAGGNVGGAGGGNVGGAGGSGGGALSISITSPADGALIAIGAIDFIAVVTGGTPSGDQLIWRKSEVVQDFGVGYSFSRTIPVATVHTLTVSVMDGNTTLASDTVAFETL